jgi:hypothetical protein
MPEHPAAATPSSNRVTSGLEIFPLDRLERAVQHAAAKMEALQAALAEQLHRADTMERQAVDLERQLAIAEARLAVEMMHSAGLAAQASHMLALGIETDVLTPSDLAVNGNGGASKSQLALVYEEAFDAKGTELGVEDPGRFREP